MSANPLRIDPTRTITLRRRMLARVRSRFARLRAAVLRLVVESDAFGLARRVTRSPLALAGNTVWQFESTPGKVQAFRSWFRSQVRQEILSATEEQQWRQYLEEGFRRGAGRAFDDARRLERSSGGREEFLRSALRQPIASEKVLILAERTFEDLRGVTEAMSVSMSRVLTDGLVEGRSPREIGRTLAARVDGIGRSRAETIARTEVIRAHAEGQLYAMQQLGVERVGVMAEWSTALDAVVCDECGMLEGTVMSITEAAGMIPRHPNCRCAWVPHVPATPSASAD